MSRRSARIAVDDPDAPEAVRVRPIIVLPQLPIGGIPSPITVEQLYRMPQLFGITPEHLIECARHPDVRFWRTLHWGRACNGAAITDSEWLDFWVEFHNRDQINNVALLICMWAVSRGTISHTPSQGIHATR